MTIEYIETLTSTNDYIKDIRQDLYLVYCDNQLKGRGQRGNSWESFPYKNLTLSINILPEKLSAEKQFSVSKIVSLSIIETLKSFNIEAKIKWPNDIYVGDLKIAGILIENTLSSRGVLSRSIIGIGLNVNQTIFESDAPNPVSMRGITGIEYNRKEVLEQFCAIFEKHYAKISCNTQIDNEYWERLYKKEISAKFSDIEGEFTGKIIAIGSYGELVILKNSGDTKSYLFKEVAFIR